MASVQGSDNVYSGGLSFGGSPLNTSTGAGGFQFDLPLATIAAFNAQALNFTSANSAGNKAFVSTALENAGSRVDKSTTNVLDFFKSGLSFLTESNNSVQAQMVAAHQLNQQMSVERLRNQPKPVKSSSCFITTAVCESEGLPDDCETLTVLRKFRDEYMLTDSERAKWVAHYYDIAPGIVDRLDALPDEKAADAYAVLRTCIDKAIARIKTGDMEGAMHIYKKLVDRAIFLSREA